MCYNGLMDKKTAAKAAEIRKLDDKKPERPKKIGLIVFLVGLVVLAAGLVFMLTRVLAKPGLRDAEFLVSIGKWTREDATEVEWDFTEVGKGTLTTNGHKNDYDFIWALSGDQIEIETEWFYALENTYTYQIDQEAKKLILSVETGSWTFVPATETE